MSTFNVVHVILHRLQLSRKLCDCQGIDNCQGSKKLEVLLFVKEATAWLPDLQFVLQI